MDQSDFKAAAYRLIDFMIDYRDGLRDHPVRPNVPYGETRAALAGTQAPEGGEDFDAIFQDFKDQILPGLTHWQHPRFFAYFPANALMESVLAEMLMAALGVNTMLWETSPAATELEEEMMRWMAAATGLPDQPGVIQSTASEATLVAVLMGRARSAAPISDQRIYVSSEAHSSVEKAAMIAGYPPDALCLVPTRADLTLDCVALESLIEDHLKAGFSPATLVGTAGTTSTGAFDDLSRLADIAAAHDVFYHVDAAWAGSALICEEVRPLFVGIEQADSCVFNPHKWMGIQFDCSAHYVKDKDLLVTTLGVLPEYLKGSAGPVTDFRDWGVPLGRRARGLKVWFTLRLVGLQRLRDMVRDHLNWTRELAEIISATDGFELVTDPALSLFTFSLTGPDTDTLNQKLLDAVNSDGFLYLTKTKVKGRLVVRWSIGTHSTTRDDVFESWQRVQKIATELTL